MYSKNSKSARVKVLKVIEPNIEFDVSVSFEKQKRRKTKPEMPKQPSSTSQYVTHKQLEKILEERTVSPQQFWKAFEDMNNRFENRFEQINNQFEQINNRFEQMEKLILHLSDKTNN